MRHDRFHGRMKGSQRACDVPGCPEPGEFRAPGGQAPGFDGPGSYRWFCLDHVRAFNQGYDFFAGMTPEQIAQAQSPLAGWAAETRAFRPTAGIDVSIRSIGALMMRWGSVSMRTAVRCARGIPSLCGAITPIAMAGTARTRRGWAKWSKPTTTCGGCRRSAEYQAAAGSDFGCGNRRPSKPMVNPNHTSPSTVAMMT